MNPGDGQAMTLLAGALLGLLMAGFLALIVLAVRAAVNASDRVDLWPEDEDEKR